MFAAAILVIAAATAALAWWGPGQDATDDTASIVVSDGELPVLDWRLGGETTTTDTTERAFNLSARNMGGIEQQIFGDGDDVFEHSFTRSEGLGPSASTVGCTGCHINNGRSPAPSGGPVVGPLFTALSANSEAFQRFGDRFDSLPVGDKPAEGSVTITWVEQASAYPDGTPYSLRVPTVSVDNTGALLSLRAAPPLIGLGLLEAIPAADVLAAEDVDDADGDGISGRARLVDDPETGGLLIGRFGWRSATPTVLAQTATAFQNDMGILTGLLSGEDVAEISPEDLELTSFYSEGLAVTARRDPDDLQVRRGAALFDQVGCAACHTSASYVTGPNDIEAVTGETITPYTDLLLHDMGVALWDDATEPGVLPTEWRTPPLWGLGMNQTVNGTTTLLHDGRARSIEEAILWHNGEALGSKDIYLNLPAEQRATLLRFLESL